MPDKRAETADTSAMHAFSSGAIAQTDAQPRTEVAKQHVVPPAEPSLWGLGLDTESDREFFALHADGYWRLAIGHRKSDGFDSPRLFAAEKDAPFPYDDIGTTAADIAWLMGTLRKRFPGWCGRVCVRPASGSPVAAVVSMQTNSPAAMGHPPRSGTW